MASLDDFINKDEQLLPPNTRKFKHKIVLRGYTLNSDNLITGIPIIHDETKELVAFVDLKWEKNKYLP
jgi:hypothetical protein